MYFTVLNIGGPVAANSWAAEGRRILWRKNRDAAKHTAIVFYGVEEEEDVELILNDVALRNHFEDTFGAHHYLIWANTQYIRKWNHGVDDTILLVTSEMCAQHVITPWLDDSMGLMQKFHGSWRYNGLLYDEIKPYDLYNRCALWARMIGDCASCGACENRSCLRTLSQNYGENKALIPAQMSVETYGTRRYMPGYELDMEDVFDELPSKIHRWEKVSRATVSRQFFYEDRFAMFDWAAGSVAEIEEFQDELSSRSRAAAQTRNFRKKHCGGCPFQYACIDANWRWDNYGCEGGWQDIETLISAFTKAIPHVDRKPLRHWMWLERQAGVPIYIEGNWVRKRPNRKRLRTTRTFFLVWDIVEEKYALEPLNENFRRIHFHSYGHLMRTAKARGWDIRGLSDPREINIKEMHRTSREVLWGLFEYFNNTSVVRYRYKGFYTGYYGVSPTGWRGEFYLFEFSIGREIAREGIRNLRQVSMDIWVPNSKECIKSISRHYEVIDDTSNLMAYNLGGLLQKIR